jgi:hypothetical protein
MTKGNVLRGLFGGLLQLLVMLNIDYGHYFSHFYMSVIHIFASLARSLSISLSLARSSSATLVRI